MQVEIRTTNRCQNFALIVYSSIVNSFIREFRVDSMQVHVRTTNRCQIVARF